MESETNNSVEAIEDAINSVTGADTLSETPFSQLFHEARTSSSRMYSSVSVQCRVEDGRVVCHDTPVKTRQGEHLRGTSSWDTIVSLPVVPFMETKQACHDIERQLQSWKRSETSYNPIA